MDTGKVVPNMVAKIINKIGCESPSSATKAVNISSASKTADALQNELEIISQKAKTSLIQTPKLKSMTDALTAVGYKDENKIIYNAEALIPRAIPASEQIEKYYANIK